MSLPVNLDRLARAEFDEAAGWYEGQSRGRGAAFTNAVENVLGNLGMRPEAHPKVSGPIREA